MLLLVHVHVRSGFGMIDTIGGIVEKRIDWNNRSNYRSDPFATTIAKIECNLFIYYLQFIISSLLEFLFL